jgi:competence protein ComEA
MDAIHHAPGAANDPRPALTAHAPSPAHAEDPGGGRSTTPAKRADLRVRFTSALRESVWVPVAAKASAIAVGMLGLAAIGAWSTLAGAGVPVNGAAPRASVDAHAAWLAPTHAEQSANPRAAIPPNETPPLAAPTPETAAPAGTSPGVTTDGKVVLNTATVEDLVKLPRVGPKRAQAIVELRKRIGKFRRATDLLRVRGIGRKTLALMLPKLVVDAPAPAEPAK